MRGIFILLSLVAVFSLRAAEPSPPVYAFRYATFYRTDPKIDPEYLIVGEGALAFRNLDDFRKFLATLPVGATVTWRSRCTMRDPFLASEHDIAALATFCKIRGIQFIHLPAG